MISFEDYIVWYIKFAFLIFIIPVISAFFVWIEYSMLLWIIGNEIVTQVICALSISAALYIVFDSTWKLRIKPWLYKQKQSTNKPYNQNNSNRRKQW